ncbi:MAG: OmpA family protein [Leptospirales bacterium]
MATLTLGFSLSLPLTAQQAAVEGLVNLGEPVNTPLDEFSPSVTADGRTMVYNSKRFGERYQSLYMSERNAEGEWSTPRALRELNSIYNDEAPYITPDGKLIFFASDRDGSTEMPADASGRVRVSFDIYWSRKEANSDRWSRPLPVPGGVNTPDHERSPGMDLRTGRLFFARWPFGDFENSKIYEASYVGGRFVNAKELPQSINSGHQEAAFVPALDRENGYYFASRRPGGRGGWDIYYTSFADETYGEAVNLGERVNSEANDIYYSVRERIGFLSSDREGGQGRYDIYGIPVAEKQAEPPSAAFEVRDGKSGAPVQTRADVQRAPDGGHEQQATDAQGRFALEANREHSREKVRVRIQEPGYLPFDQEYDLTAIAPGPERIELTPIQKDVSFDVHAIYFDANESVIKPESYETLEELADFLKTNNRLRLEIIGHTDLHGSHDYNIDLSLKRATAVRDYLVAKGLDPKRFQVKGAGFTRPVVNQKGEGFDEKNRRTEFRVIGLN